MSSTLDEVVAAIDRIAPPALAEGWDNVGLLVSPTRPAPIARAMLAIDLTAAVLDEAIARDVGLMIAYHPPIFSPLKRLVPGDPVAATVLRALEHGVAIHSPHTALDAAPGGVNDWLADGLGAGERRAISAHAHRPASETHKVVVFVPADHADALREAMAAAGAGVIGDYTRCSFNLEGTGTFLGGEGTNPAVGERGRLERAPEVRLEMVCPAGALAGVGAAIRSAHPYEEPAWEVYELAARPDAARGQGRLVTLAEPDTLDRVVERVKRHLELPHVRVATADRHAGHHHPVRTVALCAGAGGSVVGSTRADVYLTGEMRHHDTLAAVARGTSVILCDHTHTERGYLPQLRDRLTEAMGGAVAFDVSSRDAEPLRVM